MTKEQLLSELQVVYDDYIKRQRAIHKKYAELNNPYRIGDIISDNSTTLIIKSWQTFVSYGEPQLLYTGTIIKKDGTPAKNQNGNTVYQANIKK